VAFTRGMSKDEERLHRQFEAIERSVPLGRRLVGSLRKNRYRWLRMPLALLLILGGFAWFLPVLGLWMLPAGLLLLALDVPALRPAVAAAIIRGRRRIDLWRQRLRRR
jgi:hypothetical protein